MVYQIREYDIHRFKLLWYCFSYYQLIPLSIVLCYLGKSKVEPTCTLTDHLFSEPPKDHSLLASHPAEPHPTDQSSPLSLAKQKSLNINIASYFIETLASPHENTWHHRGGPITQTIENFSLNHNHRRSVEHTWKTMISCIEQGVKYTGRNVTKKYGRPYLISSSFWNKSACKFNAKPSWPLLYNTPCQFSLSHTWWQCSE